jgi:3-oxoacyl-[acyl-carrier protein] reductase
MRFAGQQLVIASAAAVYGRGLAEAFALELGPSGVRVQSAQPGFAEGSAGNPMPVGYAGAIRARSLLGAPGTPAGLMLLCSEAARG